jgi:nucleotide-binding universal stress UspA family protein
MTPHVIVSYDGTANDQDALALARRFADAGASISLAYVRHDVDPDGKRLGEDAARELLDRGAEELGAADAHRHVVVDASTALGLRVLAERERADVVIFGSDYRTADGTVKPQMTAERLMADGPSAVAIAPAGLRNRDSQIARVGVLAEPGDNAAQDSARSLAAALGGTVAEPGSGPVDLLIVGSRAEATPGRVLLSATADYAIETASSAVLAVRRDVPVTFGSLVTH